MMRLKKILSMFFSLLLCATIFTGCSRNSFQSKQNEIYATFAEALKKFKNTTHSHGTHLIETSDSSMFNLDFHKLYGSTVSSIKWDFGVNSDVRENNNGNVTDYRRAQSITTITTEYSDKKVSTIESYVPDDGYIYTNAGSYKTKSKHTTDFISVDNVFPYLNIEHLEEITLDTQNDKKTFNFKVSSPQRHLLTNFYPVDDFVNKSSAIELVDFNGMLVTNDNSDQVSLTINIKYKNKETNEILTYTHSHNRDNSHHKLEFPSDLSTYKEEK